MTVLKLQILKVFNVHLYFRGSHISEVVLLLVLSLGNVSWHSCEPSQVHLSPQAILSSIFVV